MIFLCTGRSYNQIYPSLKPLILTACVAGGYVTVGDKVIAHHVYGQNLLQKVLDTVGDNDTGLIFQTKDKSIKTTSGPTNSYQHSQSSLTCM
ncbi:MAG: HAD hydrolase family protein [Agathobacter rectalis]